MLGEKNKLNFVYIVIYSALVATQEVCLML